MEYVECLEEFLKKRKSKSIFNLSKTCFHFAAVLILAPSSGIKKQLRISNRDPSLWVIETEAKVSSKFIQEQFEHEITHVV